MTPAGSVEVVKSFLDAANRGDLEAVRELLAPDFETVPATTGTPMGRDQWLAIHAELDRAFPDLRRHALEISQEGDHVRVKVRITATNDLPVRLPSLGVDELPPTGLKLSPPPHVDTFTVHDGRVTGVHSDFPPGAGFRGMIDEIDRELAQRAERSR